MPLTPEDVHNKQFTTVRLREGYDEEEVDAFLDEVEAELTRLLRENEELRAKLAAATRAAAAAQQQQPMDRMPMDRMPARREPVPIPPQLPAPMPVPVPQPQPQQFQQFVKFQNVLCGTRHGSRSTVPISIGGTISGSALG